MVRNRRFQRHGSGVAFNYTPLIDVFMLLTIFFMLVARFTTDEQAALQLPSPEESKAQVPRLPAKVIVNCRPSDLSNPQSPILYSIGPNAPADLSTISEQLAAIRRQSPEVSVVVRADRRIRYEHVRAVMQEVARNDIASLNIAALAAEDR